MAAVFVVLLEEENRRTLRRQRVFRDMLQPLDIYDDVELIKMYRMPRHVLLEVIYFIRDQVEHPTKMSHAIPATLQIITALRFFAEGSFQLTSGAFKWN